MKLALLVAALFFASNTVLLARDSAPARMQVVAREFSYSLSRSNLRPGTAVIELANFGQDAHDLRSPADRRPAQSRARRWCSLGDARN